MVSITKLPGQKKYKRGDAAPCCGRALVAAVPEIAKMERFTKSLVAFCMSCQRSYALDETE